MKSGTFASGNEHAVPQQAGECAYLMLFGLACNFRQVNMMLFGSIVSYLAQIL